jgi:hypothetical protein
MEDRREMKQHSATTGRAHAHVQVWRWQGRREASYRLDSTAAVLSGVPK